MQSAEHKQRIWWLGRGRQIRVYSDHHEGRRLIHTREWRCGKCKEWYPTQRGVSLTPDKAIQVAEAITQEAKHE